MRPPVPIEIAPGVRLAPAWFDAAAQSCLVAALRTVLSDAPLYAPRMPKTGAPLSVRMSNCGPLGWISDAQGYRYASHHPETGRPWPDIPALAWDAWRDLADFPAPPDACLINWYGEGARMGLHQDRDEKELAAPVVSISLGDDALFRLGGTVRRAPTRSFRLSSGDVLVFGGPARLAFHGIDRIDYGTSALLPEGGRFNLTLRRVAPQA